MKTVCCANMPYVAEAFATLGETVVLDGRKIEAATVRDADLLAIRSTTKVDAQLLEGSRVRFVGTATIGTDHMDIPWLEQQGIEWHSAAGCNANSVSEYLVSALLLLASRHGFSLRGKTIGIVGVGHVGSRVLEKACALGMKPLPCDPPRQRGGESGHRLPGEERVFDFVALDRIRAEADIVTVHVPLNRSGADRTVHLADMDFFAGLKPGAIFINAARGAVTDGNALLKALDGGIVRHAVLDTWEDEPLFSPHLLKRVDIGTPHIAGHSFEGKVAGTVMVYRQACRFLQREAFWTPDDLLPAPNVPVATVQAAGRREEDVLWDLVRQVYDIGVDDRNMRNILDNNDIDDSNEPERAKIRASRFDALRKNYAVRREFRFTQALLSGATANLQETVRKLGFK